MKIPDEKNGVKKIEEKLKKEVERLKALFPGADANKMAALEGLIEQAAYQRLFLQNLNEQAIRSGLVKIHPENPGLQKGLPVSREIAKHSAAYTNIMDKLMKHLAIEIEDDDDGLGDYE